MSQAVYERYNLEPVGFDEASYFDRLGNRLGEAGLSTVRDGIASLGHDREFLAQPLGKEQLLAINSSEALLLAGEAALFAADVKRVEVFEIGDRMVDLDVVSDRRDLSWTFSEVPFHPACGDWAGKPREFWVREGLAMNLINTSRDLLRMNVALHFEDAFRPEGVQEGLFSRRYKMTAEEHPEWTHDEVMLETRGKTAYTPRLASHKAGAAVDVRLRDMTTGDLLDIGHGYPDGGAHVALDSGLVTQEQWENRMLLAQVAQKHVLTMFPFEDWHACYGDNTAAVVRNDYKTIYGPIRSFNRQTGEIQGSYTDSELDQEFQVV